MENPNGFNTIWKNFGWANQTLSVFTLLTITVYLVSEKKPYILTLIPAQFMTDVCTTYLMVSISAFGLPNAVGYPIGAIVGIVAAVWFFAWKKSYAKV